MASAPQCGAVFAVPKTTTAAPVSLYGEQHQRRQQQQMQLQPYKETQQIAEAPPDWILVSSCTKGTLYHRSILRQEVASVEHPSPELQAEARRALPKQPEPPTAPPAQTAVPVHVHLDSGRERRERSLRRQAWSQKAWNQHGWSETSAEKWS